MGGEPAHGEELEAVQTPRSRCAQCQQLLAGTSLEMASSEAKDKPLVSFIFLCILVLSTLANLFHI